MSTSCWISTHGVGKDYVMHPDAILNDLPQTGVPSVQDYCGMIYRMAIRVPYTGYLPSAAEYLLAEEHVEDYLSRISSEYPTIADVINGADVRPWTPPRTPEDEMADREAAQYEDDITRRWD